jgi:capsular polysaccharide biosynthesis protein
MSGPPVAITTIDPPRLPKGVSDIGSPPYVVIIILGPILSLIIGLTAAFVAEYFTDTLGSAEEVADSLALPVLASVPHQQGAIQTSAGEPEAET